MTKPLRINRRAAVAGLGGFALSAVLPVGVKAGRPAVAGFPPEDWFADSTGDLGKDLAAARAAGKFLVLLWEQKGCHYCHELHTVNFKEPELIALGKTHFHVIQMDLWGERRFVDFDGETRDEAAIARGRFVRSTPVTLFFDGAGTEVFRMPGYAAPPLNLVVYQYVIEKGYETASLNAWYKKRYPGNGSAMRK